MKSFLLATFMLTFSATAFSDESGLDPVTKIHGANLICGKVNGKFVIFSAANNKVWYLLSTPANYKHLKAVKSSRDLHGVDAYEYNLEGNRFPLPTAERGGGGAIVHYRWTQTSWNGTSYSVRPSSSGALRVFEGENGTNGVCHFLR